MPNLRPSNAPPSLGRVTTVEIDDTALGLEADVVAQREAEALIRAASAPGKEIPARPAPAFRPVAIHIAMGADDEDGEAVTVAEAMTAERGRFDA